MELKITNRITRKVNSLKWKWGLYKIRFSMWKIGFNLKTMNIRIALNPKIIKLKARIKLRRIGWKIYRIKNKIKSKFRTWKCNVKNRMIEDLKPIGEILGILFVVFFMVFMFDVTVLGIAQCFGLLMDWKIV